MTQTYRTNDPARWGTGQGFNLSPAQVDNNFWDLIQRMIAQEARPDPAPGIDHFEIIGTMMYVHMTDGRVLGPYELPVAVFRDRGVWTPHLAYLKMDTFSINGGLYVVVWDHISDATFDSGANDGAGHDYYQLMIQTPGSSLPFGGEIGQVLEKVTTVDYAVIWGDKLPSNGFTRQYLIKQSNANQNATWDDPLANDIGFVPVTGSSLASDNVADALEEIAGTLENVGSPLGRQTIWIPASSMTPSITAGPASSTFELPPNRNVIKTLDFDQDNLEFAQFDIAMPKSWDLGSLKFKMFWSHGTAATANYTIEFALYGVSIANSGSLVAAFGPAGIVTDTGGTSNFLYVSDESSTFSVASAYGRLIQFQIWRIADDAPDTLPADARLHGIQLYYTTNAVTDN